MQTENKPEKEKKRPDRRFRLMLAAVILILIAGYTLLGGLQLKNIVADEIASQTNSMFAAAGRLQTYAEINENYDRYDVNFNKVFLDVFKLHIERNGYSSAELNTTSEILGDDGSCYYIDANGNIHGTAGADRLGIDDDKIEQLCTEGYCSKGNLYYYSEKCSGDGYIVIRWNGDPVQEELDRSSVLASCQNKAVIIDTDTNTVVEAQSASEIGVGAKITAAQVMGSYLKSDSNYDICSFYSGSRLKLYLGSQMDIGDGKALLTYCSMHDLMVELYDRMSYSNTLLLLYVILTIVYAVIAVRRTEGVVHFTKGIYLNRASGHIMSLMLFGSVFMLALTLNMDLLNRYSSQNQNAVENLEYMNTSLEHRSKLKECVISNYESELTNTADLASWLLLHDADIYDTKGADYVADLLNVEEVSVFNSVGNAVWTNTGYEDYSITQNKDDSEYDIRKILSDEAKQVVVHDSETKTYAAAVKRRDDSGVVLVRTSDDALQSITNVLSSESLIRGADFNSSVKAFVDRDEPDVLYWLEPNSTNIETFSNTLSDSALVNGYAGFQKINGIPYYINTKGVNSYVLISARRRSDIVGEYMQDHLFLIVEYLIISLVILAGAGLRRVYPGSDAEETEENVVDDSIITLDNNLKQMLGRLMTAAMAVLAITLIAEYYISDYSLLSYLLNNAWDKGLNIFGLSECWLIVALTVMVTKLLKIIIRFISENLGPGALTAGHLIISVTQVAVWVTAVIICLYQIGVDPKALFASAGITSVVIGIGAQSTVSDIIAGFALVIEGHVRIGDWVRVNDFRGVVTSLGIRTTKISLDGDTISVNNSNMKDVVNLSKEPSRIDMHFLVKYGTDVDAIQKLVEGSSERYIKDCPQLIKAPHFENMYDMAASGLDMHIWCLCNEKDRVYTHNRVMRTTYEIMEENGIVIPFTTITIDNGDRSEAENADVPESRDNPK